MRPRAKEASSDERRGWRSSDAAGDLVCRATSHVVFSKVDAGFEKGDEFDQRLLEGRDAAAERATHLAGGLARLGQGLRLDEVADGLGLGEVERPLRKARWVNSPGSARRAPRTSARRSSSSSTTGDPCAAISTRSSAV
jgi:hypothetical protein